ncbi:MAG: hypothetical protein OQJ89_00415 [Kangiellaceae bacterium]|nr:hypothetical protein [Kangiellaceae bacterium]MCW8998371.1 hypothetical protein [Kangiellaceae bacterium]MCW9015402.1 hypothetical protein [Kangiellaceae bacterium]
MAKKAVLIISITIPTFIVYKLIFSSTHLDTASTSNAAIETQRSTKDSSTSSKEVADSTDDATEEDKNEVLVEDLKKQPALYTEYIDDYPLDVLKVESVNDGALIQKTYRNPDGKVWVNLTEINVGADSGYQFDGRTHPYKDYKVDEITQLAEQGDREAQMLLAYRIVHDVRNMERVDGNRLVVKAEARDRANKWYEKAAMQGYTAAFYYLSDNYHKSGDHVAAYAYQLLESEVADPDVKGILKRKSNDFTEQEKTEALELVTLLKQKYNL